jgi:cytochrome b561
MNLHPRPARYTAVAIGLHWLIALLIFAGFALGQYMTDLALSPEKLRLYSWHKWLGVTIFGLVLVRVLWRLAHPPPALPPGMARWQRRAAAASHLLLYVLMLAIPLSGWLYSSASGVPTVLYGWWRLPDLLARDKEWAALLKTVHVSLNNGLAALVLLHLAAAIKHQWVDRDGLLSRMWMNGSRR